MKLFDREPIVILAVVDALVGLVMAFGIDIDTGQKVAVMTFLSAVLAVVGRSQVTPVSDPKV
jgi:hypothetical protein